MIDYNVKPGCKFTSYLLDLLDRVDRFADNQVANLNDQVSMQNLSGFEYPVVDWQALASSDSRVLNLDKKVNKYNLT